MTMHNPINIRISLQNLTVDIAFRVSTDGTRQGRAVGDVVFAYVCGGGDGRRPDLQSDEESGVCVGVADADVAEGVEDGVVGQDVVCGYEGGEEGGYVLHCGLVRRDLENGLRSSRVAESGKVLNGTT